MNEREYLKNRPVAFAEMIGSAEAAEGETKASFSVPDGYMELALTLIDAFNQAARGKGEERHANGRPFNDQPIMQIPRLQGNISGLVYQIAKKANEADLMHERGAGNPAIREFYGVINYAAAAIMQIKEQGGE